MIQMLTQEKADNLILELQKLEDFMQGADDNDKILNSYFPHAIYEVKSILDSSIGSNINYKDVDGEGNSISFKKVA